MMCLERVEWTTTKLVKNTYPFAPFIRSIKKIWILKIFIALLQRRQWFVKVHWKTNFGEIFSNIVFNHRPQTYALFFFNWIRQFLTTFNFWKGSTNRPNWRVNSVPQLWTNFFIWWKRWCSIIRPTASKWIWW